jgi:fatty-acyl-CoA synthase
MAERALIHRDMTIHRALREVATRYPRRTALLVGDARITYQQLLQRSQALATHLHRMGLRKGDRIATLLWCDPSFIYLLFSASMLGAVFAPLPPRMRREHMLSLLDELNPALVAASGDLEIPGGFEALMEFQRRNPSLRRVLMTDAAQDGKEDFASLLHMAAGGEIVEEDADPKDLFVILYTSGTTGRPKGIMHSHRGLISPVVASIKLRAMWMTFLPTFRRLRRWVRVLLRYGARLLRVAGRPQTMLSTMAMHTISGLEASLQALLMGDRLVMLPRFHPVRVLEAIQRYHVTVLIGPPLTYLTMLRVSDFDRYRLSSLVICAVGSMACPPELAREIRERFGCAVHIGFGMTELGGGIAATSLEDNDERQAETVGQAMPGMEVRIVDEERNPLPAGKIGELACRSDSIMLGYYGQHDGRGEILDSDGWLYTGDLATIDQEGYIRIVGRKKDMIIRAGQNIYPVRIENILAKMEGVAEAAVVGVPDPISGESVWAFVIPAPSSQVDEGTVLQFCRKNLEAYEIPQHVRIVQDFPRTASSKPRKIELRQKALEEMDIREEGN